MSNDFEPDDLPHDLVSEESDDAESNQSASDNSDSNQSASDNSNNQGTSDESEQHAGLPDVVAHLQQKLLGDYTLPPIPPASISEPRSLSESEFHSLRHYVAWKRSNGTVKAFKLHSKVLQAAAGVKILSLYSVQKLAMNLTDFRPSKVDMCPHSCIAYTGEFETMTSCPYVKEHKICGQPRYKHKSSPSARNKPRAQMMYLPIMATIRAMFANAETSKLLRHRDKCLQQALHLVATAADKHKYSDFADSQVHMHHYKDMHLFQEPRDIALAISTDGAQLTMKKQSNTWLVILILLNLAPEIRSKSGNVIVAFATPGSRPPGHMESFIHVIFEQMAAASEGIWTWDAIDSSYFVNRAYICMALGDMLGSAKLNGMAGHSAIYGDRFSMVKGARASKNKGAKSQYYPMSPPENSTYNPDRPESYDLDDLPLRDEDFYWKTIAALSAATSKAAVAEIVKKTGISRMPLCAAAAAFLHPSFFPLDPFHLFYENDMAFLWDLWTIFSLPSEKIHLSAEKARLFGKLLAEAMSTLPPAFCGPVRDVFLKRQSQYKIYEWMALLHWYILPIGMEIGVDPAVLENLSYFVEAVEFAMTIKPRTDTELHDLHNLIKKFLQGFEKLYVGKDPQKISRVRLCIFQLIHVPTHIEWNGSIRLGSQATVERAIGEMGHKIRSKKAPFAELANIIFERELVKLLMLYYPSLEIDPPKSPPRTMKLFQEIKILKRDRLSNETFSHHLQAICIWLQQDFDPQLNLYRWGKLRLIGGHVLRSHLSETRGVPPDRSSSYFEAKVDDISEPIFGQALVFFEVLETHQQLVLYHPVVDLHLALKRWKGTWSEDIRVLPVSAICHLIAIWNHEQAVYILRKHPGLEMLTPEEAGSTIEDGDNDDDNDDDND